MVTDAGFSRNARTSLSLFKPLSFQVNNSCVAKIQTLEKNPNNSNKKLSLREKSPGSAPSLQGRYCSALTMSHAGSGWQFLLEWPHSPFQPQRLPSQDRKAECPRVLIFYFRQTVSRQTGCSEAVISGSQYHQLNLVHLRNRESCSGDNKGGCPSLP